MKLSSDTKAVLRELRRHNRALEVQLERVADALQGIMLDVADTQGEVIEAYAEKLRSRTGEP